MSMMPDLYNTLKNMSLCAALAALLVVLTNIMDMARHRIMLVSPSWASARL